MELWDIYDENRVKTGRTHQRGLPMEKGDYHLVVHIWIMNNKGQFLIQKRQPWKIGHPGMWDCAAAGSAIQGDNSIEAALRETQEEIGVQLERTDLEPLFTIKFSNGFDNILLVRKDIDIADLKLQYEEVADAKWVTEEEIRKMITNGQFVPFYYVDQLFATIKSKISLKEATVEDTETLLAMQKEVFMPIYEKYQDHETSPVNQSKERFVRRFEIGDYYKIYYENNLAGSIFVFAKKPGTMKLHIMNILDRYQDKKIAQEVMTRLELLYPQAKDWELETIQAEKRNCHLYEKMGYVKKEDKKEINEKLTIVTYIKEKGIQRIHK